jgi:hypothetical protein
MTRDFLAAILCPYSSFKSGWTPARMTVIVDNGTEHRNKSSARRNRYEMLTILKIQPQRRHANKAAVPPTTLNQSSRRSCDANWLAISAGAMATENVKATWPPRAVRRIAVRNRGGASGKASAHVTLRVFFRSSGRSYRKSRVQVRASIVPPQPRRLPGFQAGHPAEVMELGGEEDNHADVDAREVASALMSDIRSLI